MKAWEAKTTQRTAKGAGLTLMAVSLAACNDDNPVAVVDPAPVNPPVAPAGQTFTLTTGSDAVEKRGVVAKMMEAWEAKATKRAANATGFTLMAVSLAACNDDAAVVVEEEEVVEEEVVDVIVHPAAIALTASDDTLVGTALNDTYTATSATISADDIIVDTSTTDSDVLNLTLTAAIPVINVSGIEAINVTWDSLLTPTMDLDDVEGATVTLTTSRTGQSGNANVDNAGENDVVFGSGFVGTVTVDGLDGASVTAAVANSVDVGTGAAADGVVIITATVAETVNVTGGDTVTVSAVAADDITIDGADAETVNLTVGVDADVNIIGVAAAVVSITNSASSSVELTIANTSVYDTLSLSGSIDLNAEVADISEKTITGASTVTISDAIADLDTTGVSATGFVFETTAAAAAELTIASGQSFTFETALSYDVTLQTDADADGSADSANITLELETGANALIIDTADQEIETFTVTIDADSSFDDTADFDIADIQGNAAAGTTIVLVSADADVEVTVAAFDAASLDGSGVEGELDVTQSNNETASVTGAAGATTAVFAGTTAESIFESTNTEDDSVTFVTTTGGATAVFAAGDNTLLANELTTGSLAVTAGAGDDVVELDDITTGTATLVLGDGDNTVRFGATGDVAAATLTVTTGTGDNTLVIEEDATVAGTTITFDFGTGTGTLDLSDSAGADITLGTMSFTGLDVIDIGSADTLAEVNATLLDGTTTITISGDGTAADTLTVNMTNTAAASVDFSGVTIASGVTTALAGLNVVGSNFDNTIIGTDGDDEITGGNGDDTITGGDGDDTLDGGAGEDTYLIAFGGEGVDTIAFVVADDVIDFTGTSDVVDGGGAGAVSVGGFEYINVLANATFVGGMNIVNSAIMGDVVVAGGGALADVSLAELATYFADTDGSSGAALTFGDTDDVVYAVVSNATDSVLLLLEDNDADLAVDDTDITIIAHFVGVADADFLASNFADFV